VVEVTYDHVSDGRIRHGTKIARWRDDKAPARVPRGSARSVSTPGVPSVDEAVARYAAGAFPMDDDAVLPEIPWYVAPQRAVFELDDESRAAIERKVHRSVVACDGFEVQIDEEFEAVLNLCAEPPDPDDGVWITPRMKALYRALHVEGFAHSFELWVA